MRRSDYHRLIDRGRKAGLGTGELYRAMTGQKPDTAESVGETDGNGFVAEMDAHGQTVYRPGGEAKRS